MNKNFANAKKRFSNFKSKYNKTNSDFEEFLIKHRKQTSGRLANKVFQFSNGWNLILRKVQEMCPKNKITKEELESILVFIGQKELNWN